MLNTKCVIVVDQDLPLGVIANTAAVLSLSIGKHFPEIIGDDLQNSKGERHRGITTVAIPVLKRGNLNLNSFREILKAHEAELTVFDLISATMTTKSYGEYAEKLKNTPPEQVEYFGIAVCGDTKLVNKFTGSLGLLR